MDSNHNPFLNIIRLPVELPQSIVITGIFVHITSIFLPWLSGLSLMGKLILSAIPVISFYYYYVKYYRAPIENQVKELVLNSKDKWQVQMEQGQIYTAELGKIKFVHPLLTIISLNYNKKQQDFIFTSKTLDKDTFRRLRVRLRYSVS